MDVDPATKALIAKMEAQRADERRRAFANLLAKVTLPAAGALRPGREIEDRELYNRDAGLPTRSGLAA